MWGFSCVADMVEGRAGQKLRPRDTESCNKIQGWFTLRENDDRKDFATMRQ
jgi:hypothetical protein